MSDRVILNTEQLELLHGTTASLIQMNEGERSIHSAKAARNFDIQRRGQNLPGDVGNNFGLHNSALQGSPGMGGPYDMNYPGSYRFGGMLGGLGLGPSSYLLNHGIQGSNTMLSRSTKMAHNKMNMCVSAYKGFGIAKNVIDLMANFAAEGLTIKHPNKTVQRFYKRWMDHVDLKGRVKDMLRYYYKYGNVFIYTTYGTISKKVYDKMRRARAAIFEGEPIPGFNAVAESSDINDPDEEERLKDADQEAMKPQDERNIPWRYTMLNPFQMELRGSKFFGQSRWVFVLDEGTRSEVNSLIYKSKYIDFLDESDINLPEEFAHMSKKISPNAKNEEQNDPRVVDLDQKRLWTMHYMKDDHEDWADPLLWPVMSDIHYKNKLRQMDISVCDSVINAVTIFKLGDIKSGYMPPDEHFTKFAEFLRTPTAAMNMVWNDAISIEDTYPPVDKILGLAKYESVDRDILRGIGISDTILGGASSSNFSSGFLGVRTLLERLEEGRDTVMRWINKQLQLIASIMGHRKLPKVRFGKMSLRDEKAEKQLFLGLLDRNIISVQSVHEMFGEDFEIEIERMREEERIRDADGLLLQHGPFTDPMATMTDEETMQAQERSAVKLARMKAQTDKRQKGQEAKKAGVNGRPPNTEGVPQEKKRATKPRGMAWIMEYEKKRSEAFEKVEGVEKVVAATILSAKGKKTKRSLTKHECKGIEEITFAVASRLAVDISLESVQETLKEHNHMDEKVYANYKSLRSEDMTLDERKMAIATAIAMKEMEGQNDF